MSDALRQAAQAAVDAYERPHTRRPWDPKYDAARLAQAMANLRAALEGTEPR